ncbi:minor capsid protein [Alloacidobacterium dinghuense]|uniref:Minor capsid protein n=1 Tax=Alloacidobacterium dinghuense TaxID=2763107 RepID=A0A7G8BPQ6_9BACT|nr:phage minor head protein [Alloacidobacterium dinghuense]QNI34526.1 minor capsid protein [Alloacidobacterium dinghuense]
MKITIHHGVTRDNAFVPRMGELLARKLASADMLGRLQIVRHAYAKTKKQLPLSAAGSHVKFDEGDVDLGIGFDVGGNDAADYVSRLTPVTKQVFDGLTSQYRKDAFTLAATSDVRLVQKVQAALADIASKGGTASDFRAAANKIADDAGVTELNAFTLDTAYNTAMQKAYSSGRLVQMREPHMMEALPFWQYWTVGDLRVRPEHAVLDGFCAHAIDPVWLKIYPPSGFNCRCSVVPIPAEEAPKDSDQGGLERLPALAMVLVPQQGFTSLLHAI